MEPYELAMIGAGIGVALFGVAAVVWATKRKPVDHHDIRLRAAIERGDAHAKRHRELVDEGSEFLKQRDAEKARADKAERERDEAEKWRIVVTKACIEAGADELDDAPWFIQNLADLREIVDARDARIKELAAVLGAAHMLLDGAGVPADRGGDMLNRLREVIRGRDGYKAQRDGVLRERDEARAVCARLEKIVNPLTIIRIDGMDVDPRRVAVFDPATLKWVQKVGDGWKSVGATPLGATAAHERPDNLRVEVELDSPTSSVLWTSEGSKIIPADPKPDPMVEGLADAIDVHLRSLRCVTKMQDDVRANLGLVLATAALAYLEANHPVLRFLALDVWPTIEGEGINNRGEHVFAATWYPTKDITKPEDDFGSTPYEACAQALAQMDKETPA